MRTRDEVDVQAAEHAIGLTEPADPLHADPRIANDRDFAQAVATWRERLRELDATAVPAPASQLLWQRIASSLAVPHTTDSPSPSNRRAPSRFVDIWQSLTFWRAIGLCGSAAAIALAIVLPGLLSPEATGPIYVAVLMSDANQPAAIVNTYRDGRAELVSLDAIAVPDGRSLQIWTLWDRERGPVSVGLLDRARSVPLDLAKLPPTTSKQLFEISLEPKQGSPIGRPTGPVLMKGLTNIVM